MSGTQGYITAAVHRVGLVQMAVDLRLSLRAVDPTRQFTLVTDDAMLRVVDRHPGVFDRVVTIPAQKNFGHSAKIFVGEASPYNETLFIDADCIVLRPLDELWQKMAGRHFAVPGEYVDATDQRHHHNYPIAEICRAFQLEQYYWASSPLFYFDDSARPLLTDIMHAYASELPARGIRRWDRGWPPDEIAFGVVGGRQRFPAFPEHQTLIKQFDLPSWRAGEAPHEVFHCTMLPALSVLDWLMRGVAQRRRLANVPQGSRRYWMTKALSKGVQQRVTRALGLPWRMHRAASSRR